MRTRILKFEFVVVVVNIMMNLKLINTSDLSGFFIFVCFIDFTIFCFDCIVFNFEGSFILISPSFANALADCKSFCVDNFCCICCFCCICICCFCFFCLKISPLCGVGYFFFKFLSRFK